MDICLNGRLSCVNSRRTKVNLLYVFFSVAFAIIHLGEPPYVFSNAGNTPSPLAVIKGHCWKEWRMLFKGLCMRRHEKSRSYESSFTLWSQFIIIAPEIISVSFSPRYKCSLGDAFVITRIEYPGGKWSTHFCAIWVLCNTLFFNSLVFYLFFFLSTTEEA